MKLRYDYTHLDAKGDQGRKLLLLVIDDTPLFSSRLALPRGGTLLEWVGSRCLNAGVAKKAGWRVGSHRVFGLYRS